jgi:hypothetical protein
MNEPVALTFSLKYLVNFCKASGLSDHVKLCLSSEVPLLVEYSLQDQSYLRFYLAPKVKTRLSLHITMANLRRLATKSKRIMISLTYERHVFRIDVEDLRRNGFDMHRASFRFMVLACDIGEHAVLRGVFRALGTKGKLRYCPTDRLHVIPRGIQIRESNIVNQQHTPPALLYLFPLCVARAFLCFVPPWLPTR